MTKSVRIENADTSDHYKVRVHIEVLNADGHWVRENHRTKSLDFPTQLVAEYIHDRQRIVIEEA